MARCLLLAPLLSCLSLFACAASSKPPGYEDAMREVRSNAQERGRHAFIRAVHRHSRKNFEDVERDCRSTAGHLRGVTLVYLLNDAGEADRTLVYPESPFATCIMDGLTIFPLPPPPHGDYWLALRFGGSSPSI